MELTINHQIYYFDQELSSLEELVLFKTKGQTKGVAVALNQRVIPKSQWSETKIQNQDNILLLTATQGG
ncbi:sulfur carrier protein ThiS [Sphingobacterium litopenaei]|jgi:sulfur carrier protein|uniref:Sulfur carrier protein ThiS n=1 Tax=Sphingobacterium litopenaei TaxID=2763500 RepID=A0ABR7YFJ7_9SPHI|nr:sulfur carrier protein ThiS [Sphingobacterium litopenaei]MBD1430088.1 sulfur carrier protein ThiS [Sphingobacterium litopenaei]